MCVIKNGEVWSCPDCEQVQARVARLEGAIAADHDRRGHVALYDRPLDWGECGYKSCASFKAALAEGGVADDGYHGASDRPNPAGDHFQPGDAQAWEEEHGR